MNMYNRECNTYREGISEHASRYDLNGHNTKLDDQYDKVTLVFRCSQ